MSESRLNIELFKAVREKIATTPEAYDQETYGRKEPDAPCGTAACIAGWAAFLSGRVDLARVQTAEILTELLGIPVAVNRTNNKQAPGDRAIVFKLRGRPEEGRVLTRADIDRIGYDFGLLTRIS